MGFGQTEDFEIILGTSTQSRKFENIKNNNKVSIVFGWDSTVTVQYEGKIKEIIGKEAEKYKKIYFAKTPAAQKYDNDPNQTYLLVKPDWARYTDISEMNPQIFELDISKL